MQNLDSVSDEFRTKLQNNMGGLVLFLCLFVISAFCEIIVNYFVVLFIVCKMPIVVTVL